MYQIMKITIYLLIALMSMGITGCPSDPLTSNEVCSGEPPLFKLYVVSDTDAPFDIEIPVSYTHLTLPTILRV